MSGIVLDVGFIGPLTRCRSGLTGMVATRGGYRLGWCSVLAIVPIGATEILAEGAVKLVFACTCAGHLYRLRLSYGHRQA